MTSKRELKARLQNATDTSFSPSSSTLLERLPELASASSLSMPKRPTRIVRRLAAVLGSIGIVGWLTMASAGALVGVSAVGELPDPIQQFVADIVDNVGIDLPDPAEERQQDQTGSGSDLPVTDGNADQPITTAPGQSGSAPGQSGSAPGQSGSAPGGRSNSNR